MKKIQIFLLFCLYLFASPVIAGSDSAKVPDDMLPWSGYWWSLTDGKLVNGYLGHPSPIEKYDAYVSGFYPADATEWGLENVYNPDAPLWAGYCDDWAAASVLASEPDHAGELNGINFRVGDKKGLLTLYYDQNYEIVIYGERYSKENKSDINDIYPGGTQGFHQILINYISDQGVPVIMELDAGEQIWNYPAYQYEMDWYDENNKRHVTCMVSFADDLVYPDFVGLQPFVKTYTYWLEIDENGNIKDSPGGWEGDSIDDHPDFIWYPVFFGNKSFLKDDVIAEIIASRV